MLFEPTRTSRYDLYSSCERFHIIVICYHGISELNGHIGTTERLRGEVFLIVYIDDANNLVSALKGNLLNHLTHLAIAYQCYLHKLKKIQTLCLTDIIDEPLAYLFRTILGTILDLNLRSTHISIERSIYRLAHQSSLLLEAKVLKQHGYR